VLVCFDATVLCGALRRPTGPNFRLLELAAEGVVVEGFTTEVLGMECVRNALEGLGGVQYEIAVVEEFLDAFGALFDPDRVATSPVGGEPVVLDGLDHGHSAALRSELVARSGQNLLALENGDRDLIAPKSG
jgi:hypothetical protein